MTFIYGPRATRSDSGRQRKPREYATCAYSECGAEFEIKHKNQRHCSRVCAARANRHRAFRTTKQAGITAG
jgi:hypothetical protein